jgi:dihydrofolate reductase
MHISMIAAMAHHRIIGANNRMPWHLPADLAHFKRITLNKPVVMGRKTFESIGRPLPDRHNIVVSSNADYSTTGITLVNNCQQAIQAAGQCEEVMIIGGGAIYRHFLPLCQRLYLTLIDLQVEGDTQFPDYEHIGSWRTTESETFTADDRNPHSYQFVTLEKV